LPPDWTPSEATVRRFREQERVEPLASLERFVNHWLAATGKNATKADWERTFINWVLRDIENGVAKAVRAPDAKPAEPEADAMVGEAAAEQMAKLVATLANAGRAPWELAEEPSVDPRIAAYVRGATAALGYAYIFPSQEYGAEKTLADIIAARCEDKAQADDWLEREVSAFVKAVRRDEKWRVGFGPKGLLQWLNDGRQGAPKNPAHQPIPLLRFAPGAPPKEQRRLQDPPPPMTAEEIAECEAARAKFVEATANIGRGGT
jgi:hypothetical protein